MKITYYEVRVFNNVYHTEITNYYYAVQKAKELSMAYLDADVSVVEITKKRAKAFINGEEVA